MEHFLLLLSLLSFILFFTFLIIRIQKHDHFTDSVDSAFFFLQLAICLNLFVYIIYLYLGVNLSDLGHTLGRIPYRIIMGSHLLQLFASFWLNLNVIKKNCSPYWSILLFAIVGVIYLYDQNFPRWNRGIHPYYSPVDYIFYLSTILSTFLMVHRSRKRKYYLIFLFYPLLLNEQLEIFPVQTYSLPVLVILLSIYHIFRFRKKDMDEGIGTIDNWGLSKREIMVVHCLLEGLDNKAIADKLYISLSTVKTHLYRIYKKANVSSRLELVQLVSKRVKK